MRFFVQAAVLLFITGIPAALLLARIRSASSRAAGTVLWIAAVIWLAGFDLAQTADDSPSPRCASAHGAYPC